MTNTPLFWVFILIWVPVLAILIVILLGELLLKVSSRIMDWASR